MYKHYKFIILISIIIIIFIILVFTPIIPCKKVIKVTGTYDLEKVYQIKTSIIEIIYSQEKNFTACTERATLIVD